MTDASYADDLYDRKSQGGYVGGFEGRAVTTTHSGKAPGSSRTKLSHHSRARGRKQTQPVPVPACAEAGTYQAVRRQLCHVQSGRGTDPQMEPREQALQHRGEVRRRVRRARHNRGTPQAGESAGEPTQRGVRGRHHDQDYDSARDGILLPRITRRQQERKTTRRPIIIYREALPVLAKPTTLP